MTQSNDPYSKFTPGQRVRDALSATRQNALTDAARANRGQGVSFTDSPFRPAPWASCVGLVQVASALPRFSIVELGDIVVAPPTNLSSFQENPVQLPSGNATAAAITLEPGPGIIPAVVAGYARCQVNYTTGLEKYVYFSSGVSATLTAIDTPGLVGGLNWLCGTLIYLDTSGGSPGWAIVNLSLGAGGVGSDAFAFLGDLSYVQNMDGSVTITIGPDGATGTLP